jgi:L-lactate dehydrogenase complex protein LldG
VSAFENIVSRIRAGLRNNDAHEAPTPLSESAQISAAGDNDLHAQFVAALTAVGGKAIEAADETGAADKIAELIRSAGLHSAAIGEGITVEAQAFAERLSRDGCQIARVGPAWDRRSSLSFNLRETLPAIDAGIVEADYAIAPTGTLVLIGQPARPRSLSLLPPTNVVLLRADRILPDLAAVLRAVGPRTAVAHPMVMVTGPSRTADIEKRIVIGVHGPKELYVVIIADHRGAPQSKVVS